ncbi:transposase [Klebsiella michiganensis]|nr:transposase [Klebsiella michiganensis]
MQPLLPIEPATLRAEHLEDPVIINSMLWVLCSSALWRGLSERYGPWKTIYNRLNRW